MSLPSAKSLAPPMAKPSYISAFPSKHHRNGSSMSSKVQHYFALNWPWNSEDEKQKYTEQDIEGCTSLSNPNVSDDRLEVLMKWYTWAFLLDDQLEVKNSQISKKDYIVTLMNIILGLALPDGNDKLQAITYDIFQEFVNVSGEGNNVIGKAMQQSNVDMIKSTLKAVKKCDQHYATAEEYLTPRVERGGVGQILLSVRWAFQLDLPTFVLEHPLVRQLETIAGHHMILANDLYSYRKEIKALGEHGDVGSLLFDSAVAIIMKEKQVTEEVAYEDIYARLHHLEDRFFALEKLAYSEFESAEREKLQTYLDNTKFVMTAIVNWSSCSVRYNVE